MRSLCVILLLAIFSQFALIVNSEDVSEYLVRRLRETKVKIVKNLLKKDTTEIDSNVTVNNLWSRNCSERTLMVNMFNKMCIIEGNRILSVVLKPATENTSSTLEEVTLIKHERPIKFVKSIIWKAKLYLLVCHEDENCDFYTGNNNFDLKHRQTIKDKGWPVDAIFFTRGNYLYLVVAHNSDQFPVSSIIYRWTGDYMDGIHWIATTGAVSVTAFNYRHSAIIIFALNDKYQPDIDSEVYEFKDNGCKKIHYLPTNRPTSVHYYIHNEAIFLVVINEFKASDLFLWDGNEFIPYNRLPDIVAPSIVKVVNYNGLTLFFVSHESFVTLYKISGSDFSRLNLLELKNGEKVVDMGVWFDEKAKLTLLLITVDPNNLYRVEPWELRLDKTPTKANVNEAEGSIDHCLDKLENRLNDRMDSMETVVRNTWPALLPSVKNINIGALNSINGVAKLILHSGSIERLDVFSSRGILLASEIEALAGSSDARGFRKLVNSILEQSRKTMKIHGTNRLVGDVTIQGNAVFQGLKTNSINANYWNEHNIDFSNSIISATKNQIFSKSHLYGKNISIGELQIDRICGIPFNYWLRNENENSNNIFLNNKDFEISNDTIVLQTELVFVDRLNLRAINSVELDRFFNDLFIPGQRQLIKGNIIQSKMLQVDKLKIQQLNGIAYRDLITINTNQNLESNVFVRTMEIENLIATKINGISVSEYAMTSKKNNIKGQVKIATLRILDELAIENPSKFPKFRSVQVYDEVTIDGNVRAKYLTLEPYTNFNISLENGSAIDQTNIDSILDSYWTKSSPQIIKNPVNLRAGLTVDELKLRYLNDLDVNEDIMMTTIKEIDEKFVSIEFTNFTTSGSIVEESIDSQIPLWTNTNESLVINEEIRIDSLGAQYLNIEKFNGIPVVDIINKNFMESKPYEYPIDSIQRFDTITVNELLETEDLDMRFINDQKEPSLKDLLSIDANYTIQYLKAEKLTLENFSFQTETGFDLNKFTNYIQEISNSDLTTIKEISELKIDGGLLVENNLQVNFINDKTTRTYLENLASNDFEVSTDVQIIDILIINGNLTLNYLQGSPIESLLYNTLSISRDQNLSDSQISIFKISVDNLKTERINERYTSNLVYTDDHDINVAGDATFTNLILSLDDDIQTNSLNGQPLNTLYKSLGEISLNKINVLTVKGNVSWLQEYKLAESEVQSGPLETIIEKALLKSSDVKNSPQVINGEVRINSPKEGNPGVSVRWMKYEHSELSSSELTQQFHGINMGKIVDDAVLDDPLNEKGIKIVSKKSFAQNLKTSRLNVAGEIAIDTLNTWNIKELNTSIVRKESLSSSSMRKKLLSGFVRGRAFRQNNQIGNSMIFNENVSIKKLVIQTDNGRTSSIPVIHGVPVSAIVLSTSPDRYLPNNTYLKHLEVNGNVVVKSLDNVDLDEFTRERVTIHSNHEIHANIQFDGPVQVTEDAIIRTINGIFPSDFVINNSREVQIITGEKSFYGDIEISGETHAPWIDGVNVKEEYDNGVLNNQVTDIFGDVVFQSEVERPIERSDSTIRWQLNPSPSGGFVNGMRLRSFLKDYDTKKDFISGELRNNRSRLEHAISEASTISSHLPEIFHYFESQEDFTISTANVERVKVMQIAELTILNMYSNELGSICDLENNCPCRRQYIAEMSSDDCKISEIEGPRINYKFYEPNGAFGLTVTTTSVSSSKRCSIVPEKSYSEFTTISWMRPTSDNQFRSNATESSSKIYGYLSDVGVFTKDDLIFIILAIYYDPIKQSHETNSLIFVVDLKNNEINLMQGIPTSYATRIEIFEISSKGVHILFTSYEPNEFGNPSKSLLYRLEPSKAKFELLRTFTTGGSRLAKSVSQWNNEFLFLDDAATNSINIYAYDAEWDNFYFYQSIYHNSMATISSIEILYAGEFRHSQAYVIVTTKHDQFFVYEYMFVGKFQLIAQKQFKDILTMVPFVVSNRRYVFVGTESNSTVLRLIEQGRH